MRKHFVSRVAARTIEEVRIHAPEWARYAVQVAKGWMVFESQKESDDFKKEVALPTIEWDHY